VLSGSEFLCFEHRKKKEKHRCPPVDIPREQSMDRITGAMQQIDARVWKATFYSWLNNAGQEDIAINFPFSKFHPETSTIIWLLVQNSL
jgi:hypothetical protein